MLDNYNMFKNIMYKIYDIIEYIESIKQSVLANCLFVLCTIIEINRHNDSSAF